MNIENLRLANQLSNKLTSLERLEKELQSSEKLIINISKARGIEQTSIILTAETSTGDWKELAASLKACALNYISTTITETKNAIQEL